MGNWFGSGKKYLTNYQAGSNKPRLYHNIYLRRLNWDRNVLEETVNMPDLPKLPGTAKLPVTTEMPIMTNNGNNGTKI